jgi:threonine synthase
VLPEHYNALEVAVERNLTEWEAVLDLPYHNPPPSILVKLAHSYPPDGMEAIEAVRASGGFFLSVSDAEAVVAQTEIAHGDGLYVEPSTGACVAGVKKLLASGRVGGDETVVALISGSGFRETFVTAEMRPLQTHVVSADALGNTLIAANRPVDPL